MDFIDWVILGILLLILHGAIEDDHKYMKTQHDLILDRVERIEIEVRGD
jgi:hypothetical protein